MRFIVTAFVLAASAPFPIVASAPFPIVASAPATAQTPTGMMKCVAIARDAERLACFDAAMVNTSPEARGAAALRTAETARINAEEAAAAAVTARDRAESEAVARRDGFGAENVISRADRFAPPPGQLQEVETSITEMLTNTSGLGVFLLENGQLWKQVDTAGLPNIRVGDRVLMTRAPLGGYKLNFVKQKRWVLVKRVR